MTTRSERLDRLAIGSPCRESWQGMNGGERTRFCLRCQKDVYDLAALTTPEVEGLIEATQGQICARITRDRFGRVVTREPEAPPFQKISVRRASPVVAAVVTAIVGLTGAGWAEEPVSAPVAAAPVAPDPAQASGPGGAVLDGQVADDQGSPLPGVTVLLRHAEEGWRFFAVTDEKGRFQFRDLPSGVYDVEAELEGFDLAPRTGLTLGPEGRQINFTAVPSETDTIVILGEVMPYVLPLDTTFRQSSVVVTAVVGPSVTLQEPSVSGLPRRVRTELRITSVLKGKPRGGTVQIDHHVLPGQPGNLLPGDAVLALLNPLGPGEGRPGSLVYVSADPIQALRALPADPRLRTELGVDEAGWRAMSYIAGETNDSTLQELVTRAIAEVKAARRQLAADRRDVAGAERLRTRTAAIEEELRQRFVQVLSGPSGSRQ